ncbi:DUF5330 domain-containing protein [Arvimicrobium flavum]|uniref:DUF5330 domain-containing protein n=1 Tax=Arvimicrobium flavum TaxID=3393320 RepID=UPI00237A592E|nr:DUF5330 domain-containing protein [Mesorhizobium shangrilense]
MGFLIRMAFWFSLVLLALPLGGVDERTGERQIGAFEAIIAAGEAMTDIAGMCERKPDVCETGKAAIATVGVRAREASRIAYETLDERFGEPDATTTGSVPTPQETVPPQQDPIPAE